MADMKSAVRKSGTLISLAHSDMRGSYEIWICLVVGATFRWSESDM